MIAGSFDPKWEAIHKSRHWGKYPNEQLIRFVMRTFPRPFDKLDAVDLGCGGGAQTIFLGREGFNVTGVDASQSAIDRCIQYKWTDSTLDRTHFQHADVTHLPFKDRSVDFVADVCCLQHLNQFDAEKAINEAARILRPGGFLFSITARWADTTKPDTPMRKMRRIEMVELYRGRGRAMGRVSIDHSEVTDKDATVIASHWLIAMVKNA